MQPLILEVSDPFKKEFGRVFWFVGGQERKVDLADCIRGGLTVSHHQLVEDLVG